MFLKYVCTIGLMCDNTYDDEGKAGYLNLCQGRTNFCSQICTFYKTKNSKQWFPGQVKLCKVTLFSIFSISKLANNALYLQIQYRANGLVKVGGTIGGSIVAAGVPGLRAEDVVSTLVIIWVSRFSSDLSDWQL